jgi:hypothetical protein
LVADEGEGEVNLPVRKLWIWVLGIVIAAGVVAVVRHRAGGDDLVVVEVVDMRTNERLKNVTMTVSEWRATPILSEIGFLPHDLRGRFVKYSTTSRDGRFGVRHPVYFDGIAEVSRVEVSVSRSVEPKLVGTNLVGGGLTTFFQKREISAARGRGLGPLVFAMDLDW